MKKNRLLLIDGNSNISYLLIWRKPTDFSPSSFNLINVFVGIKKTLSFSYNHNTTPLRTPFIPTFVTRLSYCVILHKGKEAPLWLLHSK